MLQLAGSLQLGRLPATDLMRTLQIGDRPMRLAQAITEFGRIDKTLHSLNMLDDETKRRGTLRAYPQIVYAVVHMVDCFVNVAWI